MMSFGLFFPRIALCATVLLLMANTARSSFGVVAPRTTKKTRLFISSWGTKGPPHRWAGDTEKPDNPATNVPSYLGPPMAVEVRNTLDGTVLVSGLVKRQDRTDQFMFDLLNHEDSAFEFSKIVAFVDDVAFAKKRLLSRSARYTGLLDKLDFMQATKSLPTPEQLENVKTWVAVLDPEDDNNKDGDWLLQSVSEIATIAKQVPSIKNVAILVASAFELDVAASEQALQTLSGSSFAYTLVAVGKLSDETLEGKVPYQYSDFGETILPANATFSRDESTRLITEILQLECGVDRALTFSEVSETNQTEAKLIRGLREAGYARLQEIEHMINKEKGPEKFQKAIDEWATKNPDAASGYKTTEAWWEEERFSRGRTALTYEEEEEKSEEESESEEGNAEAKQVEIVGKEE